MKQIKIILLIISSILILTSVLIFIIKDEPNNKINGIGVDCFNDCTKICTNNQSKPISFGAVNNTCSCTCQNNNQFIFKLTK